MYNNSNSTVCDNVYFIFSSFFLFDNGPPDPWECFKIKSIVSKNAVFVTLR